MAFKLSDFKGLGLAVVFISLSCCSSEDKTKHHFVDKLLDLVTQTSSKEYAGEEYIQLTNLYDTLAHTLPEDQDEKSILAERLKKKGFKITNWGRGNFPPLGPRIVIIELQKENCTCEVSKIYYATTTDTLYQMAEGINCKRR
jgi:hypothetical protein